MSQVYKRLLDSMVSQFVDHRIVEHTEKQIYMSGTYDDGLPRSELHVVATLLPYGRVFLGGDIVNAAFGFASRNVNIDGAVSYFSSMSVPDLFAKLQTGIPAEARRNLMIYDEEILAEEAQYYLNDPETPENQKGKLLKFLRKLKSGELFNSGTYSTPITALCEILDPKCEESHGYRPPGFAFMASAVFMEMHRRVLDGQ